MGAHTTCSTPFVGELVEVRNLDGLRGFAVEVHAGSNRDHLVGVVRIHSVEPDHVRVTCNPNAGDPGRCVALRAYAFEIECEELCCLLYTSDAADDS